MSRILTLFLVPVLFLLLGACQSSPKRSGPYEVLGTPRDGQATPGELGADERTFQPGSATGFLATGFQPLEEWMDERFKVRYENMPLTLVFEQNPISSIKYQLRRLPSDPPLFYLVTPSISRRELLREIARTYDLQMEVQMVDGEPGYVLVTGTGGATAGYTGSPGSAPEPFVGNPRPVSSTASRGAEAASEVSAAPYQTEGTAPRAMAPVEEGSVIPLRPVEPVAAETSDHTNA
ncbi:MAG: hypothetical protein AAF191_06250 [Verrucomicrobiota bacterium]